MKLLMTPRNKIKLLSFLVAMSCVISVSTPYTAHAAEFPADDKGMALLLSDKSLSINKRAFILYLYNFVENKKLRAPTPELELTYKKIDKVYREDWTDKALKNLSPLEFVQIMNESFQTKTLYINTFTRKSPYPLDFSKLIEKNSTAISQADKEASALWLAIVPCLDGGSGELMAALMADGIKVKPKVWMQSLGAAEMFLRQSRNIKGGLCGDTQTQTSATTSISNLQQVLDLSFDKKKDATLFASLKNTLDNKETVEFIMRESALTKGSQEYNSFLKDLETFKSH